jgi:hypothetical protein
LVDSSYASLLKLGALPPLFLAKADSFLLCEISVKKCKTYRTAELIRDSMRAWLLLNDCAASSSGREESLFFRVLEEHLGELSDEDQRLLYERLQKKFGEKKKTGQ